MALKYSVTVRNARLDAIETTIGTSAILKIRTGAPPANCAAADSGTVLSTVNLPSDWMAAAASGEKLEAYLRKMKKAVQPALESALGAAA